MAAAAAPARAAEVLNVAIDQAYIMRTPERTSTIVVGNPLIADITLQASGMMVTTGKGYGATNIVALDRGGHVLMDRMVQVRGPADKTIVVYRGEDRETWSCLPECQPRVTLGDATANFFTPQLTQVGARNGQAAGAVTAK
jgi:hypothetical protein